MASALAIFMSISLSANDRMLETMKQMEHGMNTIQHGLLYNTMDEIKNGALEIKSANKIFHNRKVLVQYLPEYKKQMSNVAYNTAARIDTAADELMFFVENKQYIDAQDSYSEIMNSCARCHALVRGW